MKNSSLKSIIVLVSICLFIALSMATINMVTAPKIEEQKIRAEQEALASVLPENAGFEAVEVDGLPESVTGVFKDNDGDGVVAMLSIKGYDGSKPMSAAVGFNLDGTISKVVIISASGETSGIGSKVTTAEFTSQFDGKDASLDGVDAISGATISSSAVINAVRDSFVAYGLIKEAK